MRDNKVYLGFSSKDEGLLYEDVCAGILNPEAISESSDLPVIIKKDDCVKLIKENELSIIFDYVKELSRVDRLKQLFTYHTNYINILTLKAFNSASHLEEDADLFSQLELFALISKLESEQIANKNIAYIVYNELSIMEQEDFAKYLIDLRGTISGEKQL